MNSISNENLPKIDEFFSKVLEPLAKTLHRENESVFFQKKPDATKDTYFITRERVTMAPEDFEAGRCNSSEDLKKALISLWMTEGHTELLSMADAIANLAESTHLAYKEEQSSEVSPLVYVMF